MSEEDHQQLLNTLEERVLALERQVFGEELGSRIQQQRKIPDELVQIKAQIHRAVSNRDNVSKLMHQVEKVLELLELESSELLGCEAKANAILAAEPFIHQTHALLQQIDLNKINEAMNSEEIRMLTSLHGQLSKVRVTQLEQEEAYEESCKRIKGIEEAIRIILSGVEFLYP